MSVSIIFANKNLTEMEAFAQITRNKKRATYRIGVSEIKVMEAMFNLKSYLGDETDGILFVGVYDLTRRGETAYRNSVNNLINELTDLIENLDYDIGILVRGEFEDENLRVVKCDMITEFVSALKELRSMSLTGIEEK